MCTDQINLLTTGKNSRSHRWKINLPLREVSKKENLFIRSETEGCCCLPSFKICQFCNDMI